LTLVKIPFALKKSLCPKEKEEIEKAAPIASSISHVGLSLI
jgi:hypothetical protein